jgi:hypothetical protein
MTANPKDAKYQAPGCKLNGVLEASQDLCILWNSIPVTLAKSCTAVLGLYSAGWGCATYDLNGGSFASCSSGWGKQYTPKAKNICWSYTCSYKYYLGLYSENVNVTLTEAASLGKLVVPTGWTCAASRYGGHDGCDCRCGEWDPDCDEYAAAMNDCSEGFVCVPLECAARPYVLAQRKETMFLHGDDGVFRSDWNATMIGRYPSTHRYVPASWSCPAAFFAAQDGCDCACGAWDPDCDDPVSVVTNCNGARSMNGTRHRCLPPGVCL